MSSQVTLSSSMRSNLLSLQNTQKLFDTTQQRLSTGLKVNSALDGPSAYFTSRSLNNRAVELGSLMDSMGQAVQTLTSADQGLKTLKNFIEQAKALADNARDTTNYQSTITGDAEVKDLGSPTELSIIPGQTFSVRTGDAVKLVGAKVTSLTQSLVSAGVSTDGGTADAIIAIKVGNNEFVKIAVTASVVSSTTLEDLTKRINFNASLHGAVEASVEDNHLVLRSTDPQAAITVKDLNNDGSVRVNGGIAGALGLDRGSTITIIQPNNAVVEGSVVVSGGATVASYGVFPTPATFNISSGSILHTITIPSAGTTVSSIIDIINSCSPSDVSASLSTTGFIVITSKTAGRALKINDVGDSNAASKLGIKTNGYIPPSVGNFDDLIDQIKSVNEALDVKITSDGFLKVSMTNGDDLVISDLSGMPSCILGIEGASMDGNNVRAAYADQYNTIMDQIDYFIQNNDSSYKGTNLLNGQNLTVYFNEFRTSKLTIDSVVFDTAGLGLKDAVNEWRTVKDIDQAISQIESARSMVSSQAAEFGQNLSSIESRQEFTESMSNILITGADNLTLADMNEEAANMLSLRVRQELGTNALSLASEAQQSILKLF